MKTLLLNVNDVKSVLTMDGVIDSVRGGYLAFNAAKVQQPDIVSMEMPEANGETDIKSCYNALNKTISVKIASGFYNNGKINDLPTMIGTILIYDGENGMPLCIMDGSLITGIRTGAAGALSCDVLARKDARRVCVIGGGGQARMQIMGLSRVRDIELVKAFSPYPDELPRYKADIERDTGITVEICGSIEEAMEDADIAISTTPSKNFLIPASCVKPGMHIVAVGADMAGKNEWDPHVEAMADKVVVDNVAQCVGRGETRNAIQAGTISHDDIYGEIGEILAGTKSGRTSDDEITFFDTTGMAIQDNVTAVEVYKTAVDSGIGEWFGFL